VIPVGWQLIVAISRQLAWLCSFQGPRGGATPWLGARSLKTQQHAPAGFEPRGSSAGPVPHAEQLAACERWPGRTSAAGGRQVRSTSLEPDELGRRGMRRRQDPALQSWSSLERR
jgi:hypothetical protein